MKFFIRKNLQNILLTSCAMLISSGAWGATITAISKKKALIKIDEGTSAGFNKAVKACIYDEADKKLACGKVTKAKAKIAFIKVSKKVLKKLAKGNIVKVATGADAKGGKGEEDGTNPTQDSSGIVPHRTNFHVAAVPGFVAPASYNKLTYKPPFDADGTKQDSFNTLWQSEGASSMSLFGVQIAGEFAIGQSNSISVGLRYATYREFVAQADYDTSDLEQYVETTETATAIGLFTDFTYYEIPFTNSFFWRNSVGLDIDMSTVTFKATHKSQDGDDEGSDTATPLGDIFTATSKLTVVSLRLGTNLNWTVFEPIGIVVGPQILIPITTFGANFSAKVTDPHATENSAYDGETDLKEALGHKKASFGVQMLLAAYVAF